MIQWIIMAASVRLHAPPIASVRPHVCLRTPLFTSVRLHAIRTVISTTRITDTAYFITIIYTPYHITFQHLIITVRYPYPLRVNSCRLGIINTFNSQTKVNNPRLSLTVNNDNKQYRIYRFQLRYERGITSHLIQ